MDSVPVGIRKNFRSKGQFIENKILNHLVFTPVYIL